MRGRFSWALAVLIGCAGSKPSATLAPPPSASAAPTASTATPTVVVTYTSLEEAVHAGAKAKGQRVVVRADVAMILDDELRILACDEHRSRLRVRVPNALRPALRGVIAGHVKCAEWHVELDGAVAAESWSEVATGAVVELGGGSPIADPADTSKGFSLGELALMRPPRAARVRGSVRVTSVDYDRYVLEACTSDPANAAIYLDRRTMGRAMAEAVERLSPPDPNAHAKNEITLSSASGPAMPCFDLDGETLSDARFAHVAVRPTTVGAVTNDLPLARAPLGSVVEAHRSPNDGVGKTLSAWITIGHELVDDHALVGNVCGAGRERVLVAFDAKQKADVRALAARGCTRVTLEIVGPRDDASHLALKTRLVAIDPTSRVVSTGRDPSVVSDPLLAAALDGAPARGRRVTVTGHYAAHDGTASIATSGGRVRATASAAIQRDLDRLGSDVRFRHRDATFALRLDDRHSEDGIDVWTAEVLSIASSPKVPAWLTKPADLELSVKTGRIEGEIVDVSGCPNGGSFPVRIPRSLDPVLRAIVNAPRTDGSMTLVNGAVQSAGCAKMKFRVTPADKDAYGVVTAIDGVAPAAAPKTKTADIVDMFDLVRTTPDGKTAAFRMSDVVAYNVGSKAMEIRTDDGNASFLIPLLSNDDRKAGRTFRAETGAHAVFRIEGDTRQSSPPVYRATLAKILERGVPSVVVDWGRGVPALAAASLADDGEGRVVALPATIERVTPGHFLLSIEGTIVHVDLVIPDPKAAIAARIANPPWRSVIKAKLVSRDGACQDLAGCWSAEPVDVE